MEDKDRTLGLLDRARAGEREAFDELLGGLEGRLRSTVEGWTRFQLGASVEMDDVLQETLVRAFRSLGRFDWQGEDSFFRWLCGIARKSLAQLIQEERRARRAELPDDPTGHTSTPTKTSRRGERFDRLEEALASLSPEYREVLLLSRIEGLRTKEIAARMHRTPNAVKHLLARALRALRSRFGETESLRLPRDRQFRFGRSDDE